MVKMFASAKVSDVDAMLNVLKSWSEEQREFFGVIGREYYQLLDEKRIIIVNTYKSLEGAQKHMEVLLAPETKAHFEALGAEYPITMWLAEKA